MGGGGREEEPKIYLPHKFTHQDENRWDVNILCHVSNFGRFSLERHRTVFHHGSLWKKKNHVLISIILSKCQVCIFKLEFWNFTFKSQ